MRKKYQYPLIVGIISRFFYLDISSSSFITFHHLLYFCIYCDFTITFCILNCNCNCSELERTYTGKSIVLTSHADTLQIMQTFLSFEDPRKFSQYRFKNGEVRKYVCACVHARVRFIFKYLGFCYLNLMI